MKKIAAILLAAAMLFSCAACGANSNTPASSTNVNTTPDTTDSTDSTATSEPTSAGDMTAEEYYARFENAYAKHAPTDVVMTVNGQDLIWADYFSWLFNIISQVESYYGFIDWNTEIEPGYTYNDWAMEYAQASASQYIAIEQGAKAAGVEITEEDRAEIDAMYESDIQQYGGGDLSVFMQMLGEMFITEEYYLYMGEVSYYYDNFFAASYGENGTLLSDEDTLAFAEDYGYLHAKHILYKTVDDAGTTLDEAAVAEKKAAAEAALSELRACPDLETMLATFEEILAAEGEDPGMKSYPDGYYFTDGEMVESFENGTKALQEYEISDIIESSYGYHIILRLPVSPEDIVDVQYGINLRYAAASYLYGNMISDLTNSAVIEYQNGFEALNLNDLFA